MIMKLNLQIVGSQIEYNVPPTTTTQTATKHRHAQFRIKQQLAQVRPVSSSAAATHDAVARSAAATCSAAAHDVNDA